MKIIRSIRQMSAFSKQAHLRKRLVGLVPTMGYLHEGHLSLAKVARRHTDLVVMSIFINPAQFGPREDFRKYPRDLYRDIKLAKDVGVDIIFYPLARSMYPKDYKTYLAVRFLSDVLCGKSRPGHFCGVATIVSKLFNIVQPDIAYFGQKDAQQAIIIKRMTSDLNMPIKIKVLPIVREKDGLAMSSRNTYLNKRERQDAIVLFQALKLARDLIRKGIRDSKKIIKKMSALIKRKKYARIDYVEIVDLNNLMSVKKIKDKVLVALAVWIGKTRLIDNIIINPNG